MQLLQNHNRQRAEIHRDADSCGSRKISRCRCAGYQRGGFGCWDSAGQACANFRRLLPGGSEGRAALRGRPWSRHRARGIAAARVLGDGLLAAGQGTRVRVRIPLQRVVLRRSRPRPAGRRRLRPRTRTRATAQSATRCRILLLEDNDSVRTATELFLTLEGYETHGAGSVAEAEACLPTCGPATCSFPIIT